MWGNVMFWKTEHVGNLNFGPVQGDGSAGVVCLTHKKEHHDGIHKKRLSYAHSVNSTKITGPY